MQRSKIEWTEFVSNPIRGRCLHGCSYCYAERIRQRFKLPAEMSFHPDELLAIRRRRKPATIFIGSMYDIFGAWVPSEYIKKILYETWYCPQHTFIFLSKNPARYHEFTPYADNVWLGETIPGETITGSLIPHKQRFISFEPLLYDIDPAVMIGYPQIIIGAQTGATAKQPEKAWVQRLMNYAAKHDINVFLKDNLRMDVKLRQLVWRKED